MKKLVIVESPAKAKTIQKYLGKDYEVKSSKGHVVDLPKSGLAIDVENDFEPEYTVTKAAVIKELKSAFKDKDVLVLAVDPDREGEAIGWHVAQQLGVIDAKGAYKPKAKSLERIVFTEITETAVKAAAANPRKLDMDLINAQQARRILDRLVGYKLSPLLWKKIMFGLSAGRVQSVAVRLIVDRERERMAFKADEYWKLRAFLLEKAGGKVEIEFLLKPENPNSKGKNLGQRPTNPWLENSEVEAVEDEEVIDAEDSFAEKIAKYKGIQFELIKIAGKKPGLTKQAEVAEVVGAIKGEKWLISDLSSDETKKYPPPPFSTSTLQQVAAGKLGFNSRRTMQTAQKLYEDGLITYMRTDSLSMSMQAIDAARKYLFASLGKEYVPEKPNFYKTKSKVAQEAHEAVRPTDFTKTASSLGLSGDHASLYTLIRSRALASQMTPARLMSSKAIIEIDKYTFQALGKRVLFEGYLKVYSEQVTENELPELKIGQELYAEALLGSQHFTQPPARFTEASLIKEMEKLGIGRPSTYAPTIQTIQARKYVEKDGRYFFPTDVGFVVTDLLTAHFPDIVDVTFTADMEDKLDDIANGSLNWVKMLSDFYRPFDQSLVKKEKDIGREDFTKLADSDVKCPECGKPMIVKLGRYGRFLSCSNFPECKGMLSVDGESEEDIANKAKTDDFQGTYLAAPTTEDGRDFILKKGRYGEFWAHPDYPKVKDARPLELRPEKLEELYGEVPKTDDGRSYLLKSGRFGKFWAHPDYPAVKDIIKVAKGGGKGRFFKKGKGAGKGKGSVGKGRGKGKGKK